MKRKGVLNHFVSCKLINTYVSSWEGFFYGAKGSISIWNNKVKTLTWSRPFNPVIKKSWWERQVKTQRNCWGPETAQPAAWYWPTTHSPQVWLTLCQAEDVVLRYCSVTKTTLTVTSNICTNCFPVLKPLFDPDEWHIWHGVHVWVPTEPSRQVLTEPQLIDCLLRDLCKQSVSALSGCGWMWKSLHSQRRKHPLLLSLCRLCVKGKYAQNIVEAPPPGKWQKPASTFFVPCESPSSQGDQLEGLARSILAWSQY